MNKYLEKIAVMAGSEITSVTQKTEQQRSPELGGLMRPLSAKDTAQVDQNTTPTVNSLRKRLNSSDLNYKNRAKKDIY